MRDLVLSLMMVFLGLPARAVLVFSDDFEDRNRSGWYVFSSLPSASQLTIKQDTGVGALNSGYAMFLTNPTTSEICYVIANIAPIQLIKPGDYVRLSMDLRLDGVVSSSSGLRFGVLNSAGTPVTSDASGYSASADDTGYFMRVSTGASTDARITFDSGSAGFLMAGTDISQLYTNSLILNDSNKHHFDFEAKLIKDGAVEISLYVDGVFWGSGLHIQSAVKTFNEIGFSSYKNANGGIDFVIDNISVAYIPEPATMVFAVLGFLASLASRKYSTQ